MIHPSTVLLAIIGCALFVTLVAIIAFGVGAMVRHTAGAIAIAIAALFIIPVLEQALPNQWRWDIMRFLPDAANQVVSVTIGGNANHAPVVGLAAARRDRAVGRGPARRGRLPVPQARRISTPGHRLKTCRRVVGERSHPPYVRDMAIIFPNVRWWLPAVLRTAAVGSAGSAWAVVAT